MPRTGHDILFDETVLDPHYERRMATFLLKARPQTDSFGTRHWRGRRAWLWTRGRAVRTRVWVVRWRPSEKRDGDRTP